jgi:hypothetical protein
MSITLKLRGWHDAGARLAEEAMGRAVSAPARPRPTPSLGLRMEAATKAGLDKTLVQAKPRPRRRR